MNSGKGLFINIVAVMVVVVKFDVILEFLLLKAMVSIDNFGRFRAMGLS